MGLTTAAYGWACLAGSIAFEVAGTVALKAAEGFTRPWPTMTVLVAFSLSFWLFSLALRALPLGTAYAVWSGTATALIAIVGAVWMKDPLTALKAISIIMIIAGIIGLNITQGKA
ncbi:MAG: Multidrug resistance protein EbrA [Gammaproteobacteria bacterium]|nr:Multidrug resistance protein EbrA [Gammaproteobacteria bacterium]